MDCNPRSASAPRSLRDGAMLIVGSRTQTETLETLLAAHLGDHFWLRTVHCARSAGKRLELSWAHFAGQLQAGQLGLHAWSGGYGDQLLFRGRYSGLRIRSGFTSKLGLESSARVLLLPVLLKERVAALLIALSQQSDDLAGLELLVQVAQLVLDLQAYRKETPQPAALPPRHAVAQQPAAEAPNPAAAQPTPAPVSQAATPAGHCHHTASGRRMRLQLSRHRNPLLHPLWTIRTRKRDALPSCWWRRSSSTTTPR